MAKEKSPAFQFYPRDWLSDPNVSNLSYEQEGWYIHLICYCWLDGHIPEEPEKALRLVGIRDADLYGIKESEFVSKFNKRVKDMRELLELCFVVEAQLESGEAQLRFLVHPRVEKERAAQIFRKNERSESGKRGGKISAEKRLQNPCSAWKKLQANSSSSSSSSTAVNKEPPKAPQGALCEVGSRINGHCENCQAGFESFWCAYPRHEPPRKQVRKAWCKAWSVGILPVPDMLKWITEAKLSAQWQDKTAIPHATTWLNQRRWEGDMPPKAREINHATNATGNRGSPGLFTGLKYDPEKAR